MNDASALEARLIGDWRAGDRAAGDELLRRYIPTLLAFFRKRTARNVDELVQRTLVACLDAVENFEARSSFRVFLLGIARNQFLTSLRASARPSESPDPLATFPEDSPSQIVASKQELQVLFAAVAMVAEPFKEALRMFYWDGMSIEDIAFALDVSPGTVKSRLGRGRAMLKERLATTSGFPGGALVEELIDRPLAKVGNLPTLGGYSVDEEPPTKSR
jgi:RNA polymerase sigma-70 factor (ECF subfamily)